MFPKTQVALSQSLVGHKYQITADIKCKTETQLHLIKVVADKQMSMDVNPSKHFSFNVVKGENVAV